MLAREMAFVEASVSGISSPSFSPARVETTGYTGSWSCSIGCRVWNVAQ